MAFSNPFSKSTQSTQTPLTEDVPLAVITALTAAELRAEYQALPGRLHDATMQGDEELLMRLQVRQKVLVPMIARAVLAEATEAKQQITQQHAQATETQRQAGQNLIAAKEALLPLQERVNIAANDFFAAENDVRSAVQEVNGIHQVVNKIETALRQSASAPTEALAELDEVTPWLSAIQKRVNTQKG